MKQKYPHIKGMKDIASATLISMRAILSPLDPLYVFYFPVSGFLKFFICLFFFSLFQMQKYEIFRIITAILHYNKLAKEKQGSQSIKSVSMII